MPGTLLPPVLQQLVVDAQLHSSLLLVHDHSDQTHENNKFFCDERKWVHYQRNPQLLLRRTPCHEQLAQQPRGTVLAGGCMTRSVSVPHVSHAAVLKGPGLSSSECGCPPAVPPQQCNNGMYCIHVNSAGVSCEVSTSRRATKHRTTEVYPQRSCARQALDCGCSSLFQRFAVGSKCKLGTQLAEIWVSCNS